MYPKACHVGFGLVLGENRKRFRTRSSEVVLLVDLLDEAKSRSKTALINRGMVVNGLFFVLSVTTWFHSLYLVYIILVMTHLLFFRHMTINVSILSVVMTSSYC
jgi:hypothetical protein